MNWRKIPGSDRTGYSSIIMNGIKGRDKYRKYRKPPILDSDLIFREVRSVNSKILSTNPKANLTGADSALAGSTAEVKKTATCTYRGATLISLLTAAWHQGS